MDEWKLNSEITKYSTNGQCYSHESGYSKPDDEWLGGWAGFTKRRVESAEQQLSPLERKLGDVAPRGPSNDEFKFLVVQKLYEIN